MSKKKLCACPGCLREKMKSDLETDLCRECFYAACDMVNNTGKCLVNSRQLKETGCGCKKQGCKNEGIYYYDNQYWCTDCWEARCTGMVCWVKSRPQTVDPKKPRTWCGCATCTRDAVVWLQTRPFCQSCFTARCDLSRTGCHLKSQAKDEIYYPAEKFVKP